MDSVFRRGQSQVNDNAESSQATTLSQVNLLPHLNMAQVGLPTPLYVDNSACVDLGKHFSSCRRVKHIDRRVWFLSDYQEDGKLELQYVSTHKNTADIFTKPLAKKIFEHHRSALVS